MAVRRPSFLAGGEEKGGLQADEREHGEGEDARVQKKGGGGGGGEKEVWEAGFEVPEDTAGVVVNHRAGEDGSDGEGEERPLGSGENEVLEGEIGEEREGRDNEGNGGDEGEGKDFAGEPGGFEPKEEAPGFERFTEVEGGGSHTEVEDESTNYGRCRTRKEGGSRDSKPDLGEDKHEGKRPVGGLGVELPTVGGDDGGGNLATDVAGGGDGDFGRRCAGEKVDILAKGIGVDLDDGDRFGRAGLDAGGGFAIGESLVAHVALAHDTAVVGIFRDVVGALENAVFAADTLVVEVADDAGVDVFFVGTDRAAVHALGFETVVAGGRDGLLETGGVLVALEEADVAPGFVSV